MSELQKAIAELKRLGATPAEIQAYIDEHQGQGQGMDALLREQGLIGAPKESLKLDVRQPSESTRALPYDPRRSGDIEALASAPAGLKKVAPEALRGAAALTLSAAQGVPGMEALEAGAGALGSKFTDNPMSFRESRDALRAETEKIPREVRGAAQLIAGGAASRIPGVASMSPAKAGATFGAASQGLSADDMSLEGRLARTAIGAGVGGAAGKTLDMLVTGARAGGAKRYDKNVFDREDAMSVADNANYGAAAAEGKAAGGTSAEIQAALAHEKIAPFAAAVRMREQFKGASDAEVLTEAFKLMSREQRRLGRAISSADDYAANDVLRKDELDILKRQLKTAAEPTMPSFPGAVKEHAKRAGEMDALDRGASAMARAGMKINPAQTERFSPESFRRSWTSMSDAERQAAQEGVLGFLKEQPVFRPNLISGGGLLSAADRLHRAGGLLRQINTPGQRTLDDILRASIGSASSRAR